MLAFLGNLGPFELIMIGVVAVLVFGKDLPQAASKAYMQVRKLRNAVDDLRRDSGIERELRDIERNVREAEWEARRLEAKGALPRPVAPPQAASPAAGSAPLPAPAADAGAQAPAAGGAPPEAEPPTGPAS